VWGPAFEDLKVNHTLLQDPELWADRSRLKDALAEATVLVVRNRTQVDRELLAAAPKLKVVARAGVGLDNIDVPTADDLGIAVVAGLGANATSVGEMAIAMALALLRKVVPADSGVREGKWLRVAGRELTGSTWGLIGCGATGLAVAKLLSGFDCQVLGYDPVLPSGDPRLKELGVILVDLPRVLSDSDVVSLHAPAIDATRHMVDQEFLAAMKPSALLINVARGELVDEKALAQALSGGVIAGAGLDVRAQEPPVLGDLEKLSNVVLAPHIAGITEQSQTRITNLLAADIERALTGQQLVCAVGKTTQVK
jgi:D-3-phosphoglycerate dehydrogenase